MKTKFKNKHLSLLYKYKSDSDQNINALLKDSVFVPTLSQLNDPLEFGFYVENDFDIKEIINFQNIEFDSKLCLSFCSESKNRRLWNYYTNSMKGMVICYTPKSIRKSLDDINIESVIVPIEYGKHLFKKRKHEKISFEGWINYHGEKENFSDFYNDFVNSSSNINFIKSECLFTKDDSWESENEYRFIFLDTDIPENEQKCHFLNNLVPHHIIVGYRMEDNKIIKIKAYCKKKKIPLYMYIPDFKSKSLKDFIRKTLYEPDKVIKM